MALVRAFFASRFAQHCREPAHNMPLAAAVSSEVQSLSDYMDLLHFIT
jgi:hypothetical protein